MDPASASANHPWLAPLSLLIDLGYVNATDSSSVAAQTLDLRLTGLDIRTMVVVRL